MSPRLVWLWRALLSTVLVLGPPAVAHAPSANAGGTTTVEVRGRNAFSLPFATLSEPERTRFVVGNSFFKRNWVEAPASTTGRDGLGPHFLARSCAGCHVQDGRGAPHDLSRALTPDALEPSVALLLRLSVPGLGPHGMPKPEPTYGDQLNTSAVQGVKPEGRFVLSYTEVSGRFADGTPYALLKPHYSLTDLAYGPLAEGTMISPRIAPHLAGIGLLEAIPEAALRENVARQAAQPGPIKGQLNRVWDPFSGTVTVGRFGWKASSASLAHQTAAAFQGDVGITSRTFPQETCTPQQRDCLAAPRGAQGPEHEIDDATLAEVVFYQAALAPASWRAPQDEQVRRGQRLFEQAQCAQCHRPSYVTAQPPFPRLSPRSVVGQRIWPYTDLLLHDMGEALADGRPDHLANGRQWRTPPLWGIGLIKDVNGHQRLLHDGRARGVLEAVLWHGGEAEEAKRLVLGMSSAERDALVRFVESL
ncbi:MAG: di-heme oxidoredictase family protein [Ideonella sp.]|nr:di-heme oxidoredictase family protein [Ideonella sp.]